MTHNAAKENAGRNVLVLSWLSFAPSSRTLGELCHRLAISLDAGIDLRRALKSESERLQGALGSALSSASEAVNQGDSFSEAIAARSDCFGPLFVEMVRVGELTGSTPEVFDRLAKHYEHRANLQRQFLSKLTWPALQLGIALAVIGVLILVGGVLRDGKGGGVDILGFGLTGASGLAVYANALIGLAILATLGIVALRRYPSLQDRLLTLLEVAPVIGHCLNKIALARIAWTLHLTMNVELDIRRVAQLALVSSGSPRYKVHADSTSQMVAQGRPLSSAFKATSAFPTEFIDSLVVAEETGQISESMARLSKRYEEEANDALATLGMAAGLAVWALVAALVILLIFRVFGFYLGMLNDAANML